jgi:molybdopterin-guanine dinucleotide biosynthesis protein A
MQEKFSAVLMAGGRSSRMGTDKAFLKWKGLPLWRHATELLKEFSDDVIIASGEKKIPVDGESVRTVKDFYPGCGPLAGLHAALKTAVYSHVLLIPVDMPLFDRQAVEFLLRNSLWSKEVNILADGDRLTL